MATEELIFKEKKYSATSSFTKHSSVKKKNRFLIDVVILLAVIPIISQIKAEQTTSAEEVVLLTLKLEINGITDADINRHASSPKKFSMIPSLSPKFLMIISRNYNYDIMLSRLGGLGFSPHLSHPISLDDEAFGYLKRVIVTPAVYLSFYKLLHIHIQSTGQKSLCVNKFSLHHKAMFLLNSRIPLVRFSSESIVAGVSKLPNPGSQIQIRLLSFFIVPRSMIATITQSSEPILFPKLRI